MPISREWSVPKYSLLDKKFCSIEQKNKTVWPKLAIFASSRIPDGRLEQKSQSEDNNKRDQNCLLTLHVIRFLCSQNELEQTGAFSQLLTVLKL